MRIVLALISLVILQWSAAQKNIDNVRTPEYRQIAGTSFSLLLPPGFTGATNFQGFQQPVSGASLFILDIAGPLSETTKGFTKEQLSPRGIDLISREEITINGFNAILLNTEQLARGITFSKYILVFGDEQTTYLLNGVFPKDKTTLGDTILQSMLSFVYEPEVKTDPLEAVSFRIDTKDTKLQFAKSISGSLLYTTDGKVPTEAEDKTTFIVGLAYSTVEASDKKLLVINRARQLPYKDLEIDPDNITETTIDGISGYQLVAEGNNPNSGAKELVYLVLLFSDDTYYILLGTAKDDFESNLELFKEVAATFKRK